MNNDELLIESDSRIERSISLWKNGDFNMARDICLDTLNFLNENRSLISNDEFENEEAMIYFTLSNVERDSENLLSSREYIYKTMKYISRNGTEEQNIKLKTNLGLTEEKLGNFETAKELFIETLEYWKEKEDPQGIANAKLNLALNAFDTNQFDLSRKYHEDALKIYKEHRMFLEEGKVYFNEGNISKKLGEYNNALRFFCGALNIFRDSNSKLEIFLSLLEVANLVLDNNPSLSIMIFGSAQKLRAEISLPENEDEIKYLDKARSIVGESSLKNLLQTGMQMTTDEIITIAMRLKDQKIDKEI